MPTTQNNLSRQRSFRIPIAVDDWLLKLARKRRPKIKGAGVATEGNALLLAAFRADPANADKLHLVEKL